MTIGIQFNNGRTGIAKLAGEVNSLGIVTVSNLLFIRLDMSEPEAPKIMFEDANIFSEEYGAKGMTADLVFSSVMFMFKPSQAIVEGYESRTAESLIQRI